MLSVHQQRRSSFGWTCWHQQSRSLVFNCIFCQFGWEDLDSWKWASPSFSVSFFVSVFHLWSPTPHHQVQLQFLPLWSLQGGRAALPPRLRWVHLPQAELPACILQPVKKKIQFRNWVENIFLWWCAFFSHYFWQCLFNSWYIINLETVFRGRGTESIARVLQLLWISEFREMGYKEWTATNWFYLQNNPSTNYLAGLNSFSSHRYPQSFYVAQRLFCALYLGLNKSNILWRIDCPTPPMLSRPQTCDPTGFWQPSLLLSPNLCSYPLVTSNALHSGEALVYSLFEKMSLPTERRVEYWSRILQKPLISCTTCVISSLFP